MGVREKGQVIMRIVKVLNNSLVLALDDNSEEVILFGKGIGYKKAIGYQLDQKEIEKIFVLRDRSVMRDIIRLASEIGVEYFEVSKAVITYAQEKYHMCLMDHIYLSLTDHIAFTVRRAREQMELPNFYSLNLRRFNPNEYDVGVYAVSKIQEQFQVTLSEGEIANIAFHFINAQKKTALEEETRRIEAIVKGILNIIKYRFQIQEWDEGLSYTRIVTHLRLFVQRLLREQMVEKDEADYLYEEIARHCQEEHECVKQIDRYIQEECHQPITHQEELYLTIHIYQLLREREQTRKKKEGDKEDGDAGGISGREI